MRLFQRKSYRAIIGGIVAIIAIGLVTEQIVAFKVSQITHPAHTDDYTMADEAGQSLQPVTFITSDGLKLMGWHLPSQNSATIILQHGYRANRAEMLPIGLMLAR